MENRIAVLWEILLFDVCFPTNIFLFVGSQRQDHPLNIFVELMGHGDEDRRLLNAPVEKKHLEHHGALILNAPNTFPGLQLLG